VYSTSLGGSFFDAGYGIAVENGFAYVTGYTSSSSFPTTAWAFDRSVESWDTFVTKFSVDGSSLIYSTFLGRSGDDRGRDIALEGGFVYVTGYTSSASFPITSRAFDKTHGGSFDAFVAKFSIDVDRDEMPDGWEIAHGFNPSINDSALDAEGDGITNLREFQLGTNPLFADTDGDGIPDGWEVANSLDPLSNDAVGDIDGDGLTNLHEYQLGTNSGASDTDGDGMPDGWEFNRGLNPVIHDASGDLDADGLINLLEYTIGTLPNCADTDSDGRPDGLEISMACDPLVPDVQHHLEFSTYLGGGSDEFDGGIAVEDGAVYILGYTSSNPFPTTIGSNDTTFNGGTYDAFVAKLSSDGSTLLYSTYLGGGGTDVGYSIAVENGVVYVTGYTTGGFPTTVGVIDTSYNGGTSDTFVAKLSVDGSVLLYSTYLGGSGIDVGYGIVAKSGVAYIAGYTSSNPFPTTIGANDTTYNGGMYDAFVAKLSVDGSALLYSTYLGGSGDDYGMCIAVENGAAYISGYTSSNPFPTTIGANDTTYNGGSGDAFVAKLSVDGSALLYSTYLGGNGIDYGKDIAVENGAAYITGYTSSNPFPTTTNAYDTTFGGGTWDAFFTKLSANGKILPYSTYLGGGGTEQGMCIAVEDGAAYIKGINVGGGFPTTVGSYDRSFNGGQDAFVTKIAQDIDGDDMPDTWESMHSLNPQHVDANGDFDGDGITNLNEFLNRTRPDCLDTDFDGMPDGWEIADSLDPLSNDFAGDPDGDGLWNLDEYEHDTKPRVNDTDNDGLLDGAEVNVHNTDPLSDADADSDGITDADEINVYHSNQHLVDSDNDNLADRYEVQIGTNCTKADTDGDGYDDGVEVASGTDPLDPSSNPGVPAAQPAMPQYEYIIIAIAVGAGMLAIIYAMMMHRRDARQIKALAEKVQQLSSKNEDVERREGKEPGKKAPGSK
jgi:hypothetical protein